ncbi:MAG: hypothetical protein ABI175_05930, partial [Polyangiales bacterium]
MRKHLAVLSVVFLTACGARNGNDPASTTTEKGGGTSEGGGTAEGDRGGSTPGVGAPPGSSGGGSTGGGAGTI